MKRGLNDAAANTIKKGKTNLRHWRVDAPRRGADGGKDGKRNL